MRHIGVHLRLTETLADLFASACELELKTFQCFLVHQETHAFYQPTSQEIEECRARATDFAAIYLHGSYGVNLADCTTKRLKTFERELHYALQIGFTHYVLHPGSFKFAPTKEAAIECMARRLDTVLQDDPPITILLENVAHGGRAIGGNFHDFSLLKQAMNNGKKVAFCLDTAHAYVYGYDITNDQTRQQLLEEIDVHIGLDSIKLIHCNDSNESCGSKIDKHEVPGNGLIGWNNLNALINHERLLTVPIIMELPENNGGYEQEIVKLVKKLEK